MLWRDSHARRLVDRYLDPRRGWTAAHDRTMRDHLRDCDGCRSHYDRAVTLHRLMLGLPASQPSGHELRRGMVATLSPLPLPEVQRQGLWRPLAAFAAVAVVAAATLLVRETSPTGSRDEYIGARGKAPGQAEPLVGIGVSGVTEAGREYEVVADGTAWRSDYLRFFYTNEDRALRHLFVFGLQEAPAPLWYFPLPEELRSVPIQGGTDARSVQLPFETALAARHRPGPLRVVALFSERPLTLPEVEVALAARPWHDPFGRWAVSRHLREALGQTQRVVVRELSMEIAPGSKGPIDDGGQP
ncbi:MAG: hypothetical protein AMXMBFR64_55110 [Myxococcales bacterium]